MSLGLSQSALAARAEISPSYLNLIEHNKRRIAGRILISIAACLDVDASELSEGADADLVQGLHTAAATANEAGAELDRAEDLATRFPGWARLVGVLQSKTTALRAANDQLADRMAHDPFLAESLHEILSSVTAIHATSEILTQGQDMAPLQQGRFHANIKDESGRLAALAQGLVRYFDDLNAQGQRPVTPRDEVDGFLLGRSYLFADLEPGGNTPVDEIVARAPEITSKPGAIIARAFLDGYHRDALALPRDAFFAAAHALDYRIADIALLFSQPHDVVHRRLAFAPDRPINERFGLVVCDGTGTIVLRKPLAGFPMPRYASACALWPLYQALSRPHLALSAQLETPDGRIFEADAQSAYLLLPTGAGGETVRSSMLVRPEVPGSAQIARGTIRVGPSCRICTRQACSARSEPAIYASPG